jgi:malate dehydrogenase
MLRLDHNRALSQVAAKAGKPSATSRRWSSGATTRRPCTPTTASPPPAAHRQDLINDQDWNANTFLPTVGKRGAAIIEARGASSAASAANAAIDHVRDWVLGTNGKWTTMGIPSDGSYGIPEGTMFGFPVTTENGEYTIVQGLDIDAFSQERINKTLDELNEEKAGVKHLL